MMQNRIGRAFGVSLLAVALMATALPAGAAHDLDPTVRSQLIDVRKATVDFKSVAAVEDAGYVEFLDCFDSPTGGMGQHYVDLEALDGEVDANRPEAMVYEMGLHSLNLVGVEYIVPADFVDPANPPSLFGQDFHLNEALGVWILHAWIWKVNPAGTFEDFNPRVRDCP